MFESTLLSAVGTRNTEGMEINEFSTAEHQLIVEVNTETGTNEMEVEEIENVPSPLRDDDTGNMTLDDTSSSKDREMDVVEDTTQKENSGRELIDSVNKTVNSVESKSPFSDSVVCFSDIKVNEMSDLKVLEVPSDSECHADELKIVEELDAKEDTTQINQSVSNTCETVKEKSPMEKLVGSHSEETPSSIPETENCDDVVALLNTALSKDYVNCVWSTDTVQSEPGQSQAGDVSQKQSSVGTKSTLNQDLLEDTNSSSQGNENLLKEAATVESRKCLDSENVLNHDVNVHDSTIIPLKEASKAVPKPVFKVVTGAAKTAGKKSVFKDVSVNKKKKSMASSSKSDVIDKITTESVPNLVSQPLKKQQYLKRAKFSASKCEDPSSSKSDDITLVPSLEDETIQSENSNLVSNKVVHKRNPLSIIRTIQQVEPSVVSTSIKLYQKKKVERNQLKKLFNNSGESKLPQNSKTTPSISDSPVGSQNPCSSNSLEQLSCLAESVSLSNISDEEKLTQSEHAAYKKMILTRSLPLYKPPGNSRFVNGKMFECKACGDMFLLLISLLIHISRRSAIISYQCPCCKASCSFDNRCSLLYHVMEHGLSTDSINPSDLYVSLPLKGQLQSSLEVTNLFSKCGECGKPTYSLKKHMQGNDLFDPVHVPGCIADKDLLTCADCKQLLPSNCALRSHLRFHEQKPPYNCPECGDLFETYELLSDHAQTCCFLIRKESVYLCACKCRFATSDALKHHIMSLHLTKVFKCKRCQSVFNSTELLKSHHLFEHGSPESNSDVDSERLVYFSCQLCPGRVINGHLAGKHVNFHSHEGFVEQDVIKCGRCKEIMFHSDLIPAHRSLCFMAKEMDSGMAHNHANSTKSMVVNASGIDCDLNIDSSSDSFPSTGNSNPTQAENEAKQESISSLSNHQKIVQFATCVPEGEMVISKINFESIAQSSSTSTADDDHRKNRNVGDIHCKICKLSIAVPGDKISVKKHFLNHHQALFLQALHNGRRSQTANDKVVCKFPIEKILHKNQKSSKNSNQKTVKKRASTSSTLQKKKTASKIKERPSTSKEIASKKLKKGPIKVETSPFKIGTVLLPNSTGKNLTCYKCSFSSDNKLSFAKHITTHKTNPSDLQCPMCGMCFIVRPPLEKHLLVLHNVKNVSDFLKKHGFEDIIEEEVEEAVEVHEPPKEEELQENQCKVCRMQFDSAFLLEKHFRVHGGAFLLASLKAKK